jgi:hypothetical protein
MKIMKNNIIKWMIFSSLILMIGMGCQEQTDIYEKFVVPGGNVYPGKMIDPIVLPGKNRVEIVGSKPMGSDMKEIRVFWNYFTDSVSYQLNKNTSENVKIEIPNLPEQSILFTLHSYNNDGDVSVPVEIFGRVYGEKYASNLFVRAMDYNVMNESAQFFIYWKGPDQTNGAIGTEVQYTDKDNQEHLKFIDVSEEITLLENYDTRTTFQYRSLYIPDTLCIDTFYTDFEENPIKLISLDKTSWSIIDYSSQYNGGDWAVLNFIDGDPLTGWATDGSTPQYVTVDMGYQATINSFEVFRKTGDNRSCDKFKLFISNDNETWEDLGEFDFDRFSDLGQFYEISSQTQARFFKFVGVENPERYIVAGEINFFGRVK